jgi:hypothetical protein
VLLIVQGNVGSAIDTAVKKDLVNMRTFHIEYDCCSVSGYVIYTFFLLLFVMSCFASALFVWFCCQEWDANPCFPYLVNGRCY